MDDNECCDSEILNTQNIFTKIQSKINELEKEDQDKIHLLKNPDVIEWIFGYTEFLSKNIQVETDEIYKTGKKKGQKKKKYNEGELKKKLEEKEAEWNMVIMKEVRPDLFKKKSKQKSKFGLFGEILVKEYYILTGEFLTDKPEKLGGHDLDLETLNEMIEVKTGSYFTTGTAGEKIFGVPYKYSEVPELYKKPLLVILIGGDKIESSLVCESTPNKEKLKKFWKEELNITFTCFKKLLNNL